LLIRDKKVVGVFVRFSVRRFTGNVIISISVARLVTFIYRPKRDGCSAVASCKNLTGSRDHGTGTLYTG
jgi:hypothetical protein